MMAMQKPKQATRKCPNFRVEYYDEDNSSGMSYSAAGVYTYFGYLPTLCLFLFYLEDRYSKLSETSVNFYQPTWCHIPEGCYVSSHCCENLSPQKQDDFLVSAVWKTCDGMACNTVYCGLFLIVVRNPKVHH
jgi:hypothetical protein